MPRPDQVPQLRRQNLLQPRNVRAVERDQAADVRPPARPDVLLVAGIGVSYVEGHGREGGRAAGGFGGGVRERKGGGGRVEEEDLEKEEAEEEEMGIHHVGAVALAGVANGASLRVGSCVLPIAWSLNLLQTCCRYSLARGALQLDGSGARERVWAKKLFSSASERGAWSVVDGVVALVGLRGRAS